MQRGLLANRFFASPCRRRLPPLCPPSIPSQSVFAANNLIIDTPPLSWEMKGNSRGLLYKKMEEKSGWMPSVNAMRRSVSNSDLRESTIYSVPIPCSVVVFPLKIASFTIPSS
ncbi:hypothetical protein CEXT_396421 [Caerostris extrusa]|uniref:Uncharacterized protein n=1 Tax=Caerostris extrusa TaxID=172846 RepID=A0AAV4Y6J5_CAEEX|nr:hypothetical protein CEXT_396421 [Caerostris extrusa]